jgi:cobalamin biosynthesis protein CobT
MSTSKKNSRRARILENKEEKIIYSKEEEEYLGISSGTSFEDEDDEDDEDEEYEDEEDEEDEDEEDEDEDEDEDEEDEEDEDEEDEEEYEEVIDSKPKTKVGGKPLASKERFYVEPKEFDDEIVKYYETDIISDNLAQMVSKIAHKLSYASNFVNYTYREEMVGDGVVRMFKALTSKKYDREKGTNPFSYFTRIAFNAFRNRIKKEKHMRAVHEKYQEELLMFSSNYNNLMKNNQISIQKDRKRND